MLIILTITRTSPALAAEVGESGKSGTKWGEDVSLQHRKQAFLSLTAAGHLRINGSVVGTVPGG